MPDGLVMNNNMKIKKERILPVKMMMNFIIRVNNGAPYRAAHQKKNEVF